MPTPSLPPASSGWWTGAPYPTGSRCSPPSAAAASAAAMMTALVEAGRRSRCSPRPADGLDRRPRALHLARVDDARPGRRREALGLLARPSAVITRRRIAAVIHRSSRSAMARSDRRGQPRPMPIDQTQCLIDTQDGVINRRQALAAGLTDPDIRRRLRRREWARVHPGVYVDHTGPLSWRRERAWAAVLYAEPAARCGASPPCVAPMVRGAAPTTTRRPCTSSSIATDTAGQSPASSSIAPPGWPPASSGTSVHRGCASRTRSSTSQRAPSATSQQSPSSPTPSRRDGPPRRGSWAHWQGVRGSRGEHSSRQCSRTSASAPAPHRAVLPTRCRARPGLPAGSRQVHASSRGPVYRDVLYESFGVVVGDSTVDSTTPRRSTATGTWIGTSTQQWSGSRP